MEKLNLKAVPNLKPNAIFKDLPVKLKNPKCFKRIEDKLARITRYSHTHKNVKEFVECKECNSKRLERQEAMKKFGFKSIGQYLEWKKIMTIINEKKNFKI